MPVFSMEKAKVFTTMGSHYFKKTMKNNEKFFDSQKRKTPKSEILSTLLRVLGWSE